MKVKVCHIVIAFIFTCPLFGQEMQFEKREYGQQEGLFAQTIHCIHQDSLGYLIMGTENGVFLFDGHNFFRPEYHSQIESKRIESIRSIDSNTYLLIGSSPNATYLVKNNQIAWKKTFHGTRNILQRFYYEPKAKSIYFKYPEVIFKARLEEGTELKTHLTWPESIVAFIADTSDNIYVWDEPGRLSYIVNGRPYKTLNFSDKTLMWRLFNQVDGTTLAWTRDSLLVLKNGDILRSVNHITPPQLIVRNMGSYPDGSVWFTEGSSNLFVYKNGDIFNQGKHFGLENIIVNCVFKDANDIYWIGSEKTGLIRVRLSNAELVTGSSNLKINTIAQAKGHVLIGTEDGVFKHQDGSINRLNPGTDYVEHREVIFEKTLTHQIVFAEDHWLVSGMQTRVTKQKGVKPEKMLGGNAILQNGPSMLLVPGCLATGFWNAFSIRPIKEGIIREKMKFKGSFGRTNEFVPLSKDFLAVCDRTIFLITEDESHQYDTTSILAPNAIAQGIVYNDLEVGRDTWYIATSKGVFKTYYNKSERNVKRIEQLTFTDSKCIQFVGNDLWIGTTNGLFKYSGGVITPFLIATEYGTPSIASLLFNDEEGKLLIGTMKGLFEINPFQPAPKDQFLRMGHHALVLDGVPQRSNFKTIELEYNQNTFDIQVPILNFLHPLKAEN